VKNLTIKSAAVVLIQIPLILIELVGAYLQLCVMRCKARFAAVPGTADSDTKCDYCTSQARADAIQMIMSIYIGCSGKVIASHRVEYEQVPAGQQAVRTHPDRHLYAVLYPTRSENLRRIKNMLQELDNGTLFEIVSLVGKQANK